MSLFLFGKSGILDWIQECCSAVCATTHYEKALYYPNPSFLPCIFERRSQVMGRLIFSPRSWLHAFTGLKFILHSGTYSCLAHTLSLTFPALLLKTSDLDPLNPGQVSLPIYLFHHLCQSCCTQSLPGSLAILLCTHRFPKVCTFGDFKTQREPWTLEVISGFGAKLKPIPLEKPSFTNQTQFGFYSRFWRVDLGKINSATAPSQTPKPLWSNAWQLGLLFCTQPWHTHLAALFQDSIPHTCATALQSLIWFCPGSLRPLLYIWRKRQGFAPVVLWQPHFLTAAASAGCTHTGSLAPM